MKVVAVPVREDNYAYLLIDESSNQAAAVDPYDVPKVSAAANSLGVTIVAGIATHHHFDHSGGNKEFAEKYPGVPIYGGSEKVLALTNKVKDGDEFTIGQNVRVKCLATPCHTQDSICYYATGSDHPGGVFTGDTLFIAGNGRFFEGTGDEMVAALTKLGSLPDKTIVYNGHEYTAGNVTFGKSIEPANAAIQKLVELCKQNKITTGLTTIADEKQWNVFMRLHDPTVREATGSTAGAKDGEVMSILREKKNNFRG
ncbi:Metallo-hydrolase/oxidoreductase [Cyathus striatus]|nr:Metallo-hydrolase/oxidoreductase [Cyathus striatus]